MFSSCFNLCKEKLKNHHNHNSTQNTSRQASHPNHQTIMPRLTEEMILARKKQTDLHLIKKFNCWGNELCDVSIVKNLHVVEVLALSVNKITTLKPFEECTQLQELYLRKNNIQDLNEIEHLKRLPNLKKLWLEDNPCCSRAGVSYRACVLRTLPNLQILDNIEVTQEEVAEALCADSNGAEANITGEQNYNESHEQQQQQPQYFEHSQPLSQQQQQYLEQMQPTSTQQQQQLYVERQTQFSHQLPQQQQQLYVEGQTQFLQQLPQQQQQLYEERQQQCSQQPPQPQYHQIPERERSPNVDLEIRSGGEDRNGGCTESFLERTTFPTSVSMPLYQSNRSAHQPPHRPHCNLSQSDLTVWDNQQQPEQNTHNTYGRSCADAERPESVDHYAYRNARENGTDWGDKQTRQRRSEGCYLDNASYVPTNTLSHSHQQYQQQYNNQNPNVRRSACAERLEPVDCYAYGNGRENASDWRDDPSPSNRSEGCDGDNTSSVATDRLSPSHQQQQNNNHNPYIRRSAGLERLGPVNSRAYIGRMNGDWEDEHSRTRRSDTHRPRRVRNSRVLSAALCLMNELDYESLQELEREVCRRIDELADE